MTASTPVAHARTSIPANPRGRLERSSAEVLLRQCAHENGAARVPPAGPGHCGARAIAGGGGLAPAGHRDVACSLISRLVAHLALQRLPIGHAQSETGRIGAGARASRAGAAAARVWRARLQLQSRARRRQAPAQHEPPFHCWTVCALAMMEWPRLGQQDQCGRSMPYPAASYRRTAFARRRDRGLALGQARVHAVVLALARLALRSAGCTRTRAAHQVSKAGRTRG